MKKHGRKHWKSMKLHPHLVKHITSSPILSPYAMPPEDEPPGSEEPMEAMPPSGGAPPPPGPLAGI